MIFLNFRPPCILTNRYCTWPFSSRNSASVSGPLMRNLLPETCTNSVFSASPGANPYSRPSSTEMVMANCSFNAYTPANLCSSSSPTAVAVRCGCAIALVNFVEIGRTEFAANSVTGQSRSIIHNFFIVIGLVMNGFRKYSWLYSPSDGLTKGLCFSKS